MFSSIDVTQLTPEKDFCESEITKKYFDTPLIYYGLQNDHLEPWRSKWAVVTSGVKFSKKNIENGFTMGFYPCLDTHDDVCVLLK